MVFVNVWLGKDEFDNDVSVHLVDHWYSLDLHDYISSISLDDSLLNYLGAKHLLTEDELSQMYKNHFTKTFKLPFDLLFEKSQRMVKHSKMEYDRKTR